jgi:hypothetical protein
MQKRTAREIRNTTAARLEQLCPKFVEKELQTEEESDEEDVVDDRSVRTISLCVRLCCFLLFLYLCLCLNHIYHAKNKNNLSLNIRMGKHLFPFVLFSPLLFSQVMQTSAGSASA